MKLLLLAGGAAAIAGTALAATGDTHVMNVPLPDGSVARVEYVGNVPPKVTVAPAPLPRGFGMMDLPSPANFDRMFEQMDRQMRAMQQMARQPGGIPGMNVAGYGNMPAGTNSVTVVSTSNGGVTCTRTTEVVSQGAGKPPKVTTKVSGNCGAAAPSAPPAIPPAASGKPIDHT